MENLLKELKNQLIEYTKLCNITESRGIENLDFDETETYGVFLGKKELLEELIPKLEKLK